MTKFSFTAFLLLMAAALFAKGVECNTYIYGVQGNDTLRINKYAVPAVEGDTALRPVVVFAFGGGFKGGSRAAADYLPFFNHLAEQGVIVVSADYRTGLKNLDPASVRTPDDFTMALQNAIGLAVTDFYGATAFVIENSEEWQADPSKIIACGSSAGAITALQAEYMLCNGSPLASTLPDGFNYAGLISFAGAICSEGSPVWQEKPCPMLLFQGDADKVVPYGEVLAGGKGLFGSSVIASLLKDMKAAYWLYTVCGAGHEVAGTPMSENLDEIVFFIRRCVSGGKAVCTETVVPARSDYKKDFTLEDYLRSNLQ